MERDGVNALPLKFVKRGLNDVDYGLNDVGDLGGLDPDVGMVQRKGGGCRPEAAPCLSVAEYGPSSPIVVSPPYFGLYDGPEGLQEVDALCCRAKQGMPG